MIIKNYQDIKEKVYIMKTKSGMEVHLMPDLSMHTTYVELTIPFGANILSFNNHTLPAGSAHFFEHKIFAMPNGEDAFELFTDLGISANAFTTKKRTAYLFSTNDQVIKGLEILLNMLDYPYFTDENIESERKIINEEIKMNLDKPYNQITTKFLENMYFNHPVKHEILGTIDSIKDITKETLDLIWQTFYKPSMRRIVITGNFDMEMIKTFFNHYESPMQEAHGLKIKYHHEPLDVCLKKDQITSQISIPRLAIGYKLKPQKSKKSLLKERLIYGILTQILFYKSAPLYTKLLEEKLISKYLSYQVVYEKDYAYLSILAETESLKKVNDIILDYLNKDAINDLTTDAFMRIKKKTLGSLIMYLENTEEKVFNYLDNLVEGTNYFEIPKIIRKITYEEVIDSLSTLLKSPSTVLFVKKSK